MKPLFVVAILRRLILLTMYLHQIKDWPNFKWDNDTLFPYVSKVRDLQPSRRDNYKVLNNVHIHT